MLEKTNGVWSRVCAVLLAVVSTAVGAGPFFDPSLPLYCSPIRTEENGVVARGLLIRLGAREWVAFDQDLLRPVLWFAPPAATPPLSLETMSQASWDEPTRRGTVNPPEPTGKGTSLAPALPGVGRTVEEVMTDPRPVYGDDAGRGGLEESGRRFLGYRLAGEQAVISYESNGVVIEEWFEKSGDGLIRHLAAGPGPELVFLVAGGNFTVKPTAQEASSGKLHVASNHAGLTFKAEEGKLIARLAAGKSGRRVSYVYGSKRIAAPAGTPPVPTASTGRWLKPVETRFRKEAGSGPGWALDRLPLPTENPWKRRVRPADIAFLSPDAAVMVTFEGDVWRLGLGGDRARWTRIAGGLSEPLSIGQVGGVVQVFTRNGIVRLKDLNGDGETDFYENHSSLIHQTVGSRGYPLDMEVDQTGRTWASIGGIMTDDRSITGKIPDNPHSGAILEISPDGRKLDVVSTRAREPFFARDPVTGHIVMSEQQGHWVPSSGSFPVMPGSHFGYGGGKRKVSPPAVWIPHDQDNSSSSPLWLRGTGFRAWEGGVMQLSYGTGRLFLVRHAGTWPSVEGAVIPLDIDTEIPLLHGNVHPTDGSIWFAGFRIYDSQVRELEGLARLRATEGPFSEPINAFAVKEGVILKFNGELDEVSPELARAKEWQYRRSGGYGSPRLKRDGSEGVDPVATGGTFLSKDRKSVFVHIPGLKPTMQLELSHGFQVKGLKSAMRPVYFTVTAPPAADWTKLGFEPPALDDSLATVRDAPKDETPPSAGRGRELATRYGCLACHSVEETNGGHSGPTWKKLYGSERRFTDGTRRTADDAYLRDAILEPAKNIVEGYALGMGSYSGVLSEPELESILLWIKELK
ncbi:hypothetical protein JIN84_10170 [Luteolibacter yonseiensis]|uniref:Cytochrome c domain-containing protein n=1 Tax=Luteolibacter yonseiensis TaxID=1144680 RepID=A0A934R5T8_9BACT|nr:hypothetical protein [Luteolibacter yonseiensis]MBK1815985.1 hypothetical protein [Luteolibacter yonseiensis]